MDQLNRAWSNMDHVAELATQVRSDYVADQLLRCAAIGVYRAHCALGPSSCMKRDGQRKAVRHIIDNDDG